MSELARGIILIAIIVTMSDTITIADFIATCSVKARYCCSKAIG